MKRLVKVAMAITLMFMVINVANAQQGQRNSYRQGAGNGHGFSPAQGLNLTEDQQVQMKSLRLKLQQEMLPIRNKLGENKARFRTLSTAENADMKAINKLIDGNSQLTASLAKLRAANHQAVRKLLTEEQRIIFDSRDFRRGDKRGQGQRGQRGERGQRGAKRPGQGQGYGQQGKF
jgi:Spy/CpxP family protein refolding chaperone